MSHKYLAIANAWSGKPCKLYTLDGVKDALICGRLERFATIACRERCYAPRRKDFKHYGGRGITLCKRWHKFENFNADVVAEIGVHPGKGWTLDRPRNNEGYKPGNVRWATQKTQVRNQRRAKLNESRVAEMRAKYATGTTSHRKLAAEFGVTYHMVALIVTNQNWT
jgi:hypothetical protein